MVEIMSGDAGYTDREAPILEKMIMDSRCEKTKSESWARDEITRLREENARLREELQKEFNAMRVFARYRELEAEIERLREALKPFADKEYAYEGWADIARAEVWLNVRDIRAAAAAIREGGND